MKDVLLTNEYDLMVEGGDFAIGVSDFQHQCLLLLLHKGELKAHPKAGAGVAGFLLGDERSEMLREARMQLEMDGARVERIGFEEGKIYWDASYN
jgi:hypothetical protein